MRNSVILLFLLNLLFFAWSRALQGPQIVTSGLQSQRSDRANIVLLSELDQRQLQSLEETRSPPQAIPLQGNQQIVSIGNCFSIAGFPDLSDASDFRDYLVTRGLQSTLNLQQEIAGLSYRVYLPPFATSQAAFSNLEAVDEALNGSADGFNSFVIESGELTYGVVVNIHDSEIEALNTQAKLARSGFQAEIEQVTEYNDVIKVMVRGRENPPFEAEIWPQIQIDRPFLSRTENLCETIAQGGQFP